VTNTRGYLLPREHPEFQRQDDKDPGGINGTQVHYRDWAALIVKLAGELEVRPDAVLLEAAIFWKRTFSVVKMTEDQMSFLSNWNGENYVAMRNLERTVDQARKLFDVSEVETEAEMSNVREYGFYLKRGKRYELWVGVWADLNAPLLYGFHQKSTSWSRPTPRPTPDLTYNVGRSYQALRID
jgi:acetolactate synthase regulatory subunit